MGASRIEARNGVAHVDVDCLTVLLFDQRFNREVLPELTGVPAGGNAEGPVTD